MINRKNLAGESGHSNPFAFAVTAIAICTALWAGAILLAPAAATTMAYDGSAGYFPEQFVNQAKEIEPMPEMYY
jgi:hypothetical protein